MILLLQAFMILCSLLAIDDDEELSWLEVVGIDRSCMIFLTNSALSLC